MNISSINCKTVVAALMLAATFPAQADLPNGTIGGMAYFSYDQAAWATMRSSAMRSDVHGINLKTTPDPTSNTDGNRFFYPQQFLDYRKAVPNTYSTMASDEKIVNGTADPEAVKQWRIFDLAQRVPLAQPEGGFAMPVDTLDPGLPVDWGEGLSQSRYYENPIDFGNEHIRTVIGLGGSLRMGSDFFGQSGSLWFSGLELREESNSANDIDTYRWFIAGTHPQAPATIFELINPVIGVDAQGQMTLEADYKWGTSAWGLFFQFRDTELQDKVLGHISINPNRVGAPVSSIPLPGAVWLFGSALLGLIGVKRRTANISAV
ncbi:hypothetical protein [Methylomonas sp. UP202]|uniref:hypothetical protein n=1 Tax=Methylomonas sp. UP202 TaxID=3040943 RepID=UPI0024784CC9|nr:hypothetical protein [Methylomonas sp. UP202]WGS87053.1 hypothetical protein QC632_04700 [Methylomonas sp. UP202]